MSRTLRVAVTQMDMALSATGDRLERAESLVSQAETHGVDLLVLPPFFNSGYTYDEELMARAESPEGPSTRWLKNIARQLHIFVAGSLLYCEQGNLFHSLLLFSPEGRYWRYDQVLPWGFEYGIFRPTRAVQLDRAVIARTSLGNLGFLLGWDAAHFDLWSLYGGRVDAMIIPMPLPLITQGVYTLSDESRLRLPQFGAGLQSLDQIETSIGGDLMNSYAGWMRVPAFVSGGCGTLETTLAQARALVVGLSPFAPGILRHWYAAEQVSLHTAFSPTARVIGGDGKTVRHLATHTDAFVASEVYLPDARPRPIQPPPVSVLPRKVFWISDVLIPRLMQKTYQARLQPHSTPADANE